MSDNSQKENGQEAPVAENLAALDTQDDEIPAAAEAVEDVVTAEDVSEAVDEMPVVEGEVVEPEESQEIDLQARLDEAEAQAAEYLEGWQRARAEFANARKRLERERAEARRNATIDVVMKLLPILDDFERAVENAPSEIAENSWFDGIILVHRKMLSILEGENIERVEAVGQPFDPNFHEAVMQEESDQYDSDVVIRELQPGYRLEDRVLRPALVVVAA